MGVQLPSEPITRKEQYLAKAAGQAVEIPAEPITREEAYLDAIAKSGGGGGTSDYSQLTNKPQIAGTTLQGNKSLADLGIASASALENKVDKVAGKDLSSNDYSDTEKQKNADNATAISAIKDGATIDSFSDVESALSNKQDTLTFDDVPTANSNNPVKSGGVKSAIDAAVSSAYHHAGTKTCAELVAGLLVAGNEGNVYNMTDSGTTTSDFIEGAGQPIKSGDNVGVCKVSDGVYKFDLLSGFVDTTNFVQKSETAGLLKNDGTVDTTIQGDVSTLKSGLTNLDNEVNGDSTTYPYADVITIEDVIPANLADCNVKIEPVQDLHGYDKPWVGGANVNNLFPCPRTAQTITKGGYTATTDGNGYYTITGSSSEFVDIYFDLDKDYTTPDGSTHTLAIQNSVVNNQIGMALYYNDTFIEQGLFSEADRKIHYQGLSQVTYNQIGFRLKGDFSDPLTMKPYIYLGNPSDNVPFSSYENICPISGHTEASVEVSADGNIVTWSDFQAPTGTTKTVVENTATLTCDGSGAYQAINDGGSGYQGFTPGTYRVKFNVESVSNTSFCYLSLRASNHSMKSSVQITGTGKYSSLLTISENCYLSFILNGGTATSNTLVVSDLSVEKIAHTATISLGDTIYGGTVDFDSGVMTAKYVSKTFDENVVLTVGTSQSSGLRYADIVYSQNNMGAKTVADNYMICSSYAKIDASDTPTYGTFRVYSDSVVFLDEDFVDVASAKAKLNGVQLVYELATPTTIQLTPQQIQLLKGTNTLTASTGQISVTVNGVSGAIGSVQEQVNELAEDVADVQSGLTNVENVMAKSVTIESGNSIYDWLRNTSNKSGMYLINAIDATDNPFGTDAPAMVVCMKVWENGSYSLLFAYGGGRGSVAFKKSDLIYPADVSIPWET